MKNKHIKKLNKMKVGERVWIEGTLIECRRDNIDGDTCHECWCATQRNECDIACLDDEGCYYADVTPPIPFDEPELQPLKQVDLSAHVGDIELDANSPVVFLTIDQSGMRIETK